jgi:hypothetical protein
MSVHAAALFPSSVRALLTGAIDYAGLFPPASLDLATVVANYHAYRSGADRWSLGRLVVPAARLGEVPALAASRWRDEQRTGDREPWRVSALVGADAAADARHIRQFNEDCLREFAGHAVVDSVETKASTVAEIESLGHAFGAYLHFVEVPVRGAIAPLLAALRGTGAFAKIRMGGVTADAFPEARDVARFLRGCAETGVAFKATAGLHHPLRGAYRLTYAEGSPGATMYGYLNLFVAAARARDGATEDELVRLLEAEPGRALVVTDAVLGWEGGTTSSASLAAMRATFALAFGSCSFREPLDDLATLLAT